jgi:iron complex outermembrane receptor protein
VSASIAGFANASVSSNRVAENAHSILWLRSNERAAITTDFGESMNLRLFANMLCGVLAMSALSTGFAAADTPASGALEEIVVTATKRGAENIEKVPIDISAYSAPELEKFGIESFTSLDMRTPGLVITQNSGTVQPYIRGVGTDFPSAGLEPPVSVYVDDVYWQRAWGSNYDLVDLSSVQVLKGPQGSLYGRDATGGAILLATNNPTHTNEAKIFVEQGSLGHQREDLILNLDINDRWALRVAGRYNDQSGYVHNPVTGVDFGGFVTETLRGKLSYTGDMIDALLSMGYSENTNMSGLRVAVLGAPGCVVCAITGATPPPAESYETYQGQNRPIKTHVADTNLNVSVHWDSLTFTSITAARTAVEFAGTDEGAFSGAPPGQALNLETFYIPEEEGKDLLQEFRLASHFNGPFNYLVGVNGQYSKEFIEALINGAAFAAAGPNAYAFTDNTLKTLSGAAYGELYYDFTPAWKLTAGGRFSYDDKDAVSFPGGIYAGPSFAYTGNWKNFTPRVVLAFSPDDTQNYYASFNTGFKSGGFNFPSFASSPSDILKPERIKSYEVGAKNDFLDKRIATTAAIFYYVYDDIQVSFVDPTRGSVKENAGSAQGYGAEYGVQFAATEHLVLGTNLEYLHARFTSYPNASVYAPDPGGVGLELVQRNLDGQPLPRAPDYTANLNATYNFPIPTVNWKGAVTGIVRYTSQYDINPDRGGLLGLDYQKAYTLANFSGFVGPDNDKYKIGFYVNNAFNKYYILLSNTSGTGAYQGPAPPRTYGANFSYNS